MYFMASLKSRLGNDGYVNNATCIPKNLIRSRTDNPQTRITLFLTGFRFLFCGLSLPIDSRCGKRLSFLQLDGFSSLVWAIREMYDSILTHPAKNLGICTDNHEQPE
jgi:hypothetical protein